MSAQPSIILLPGLGADQRLFAPQLDAFPRLRVVEWSLAGAKESLASFAERMAGALSGVERTLVLGGCSFGGFVAWEMARHLKPDVLVLIGSASSTADLRAPLRMGLPLGRHLPTRAADLLKAAAPFAASVFGATTEDQRRVFVEMLRATPSPFLAWATRAIASWTPSPPTPGVVVRRLHGRGDRIIGPPMDGCCEVIEGGHLLTLTSPREVNRFLAGVAADEAQAGRHG